MKNTTEQIEKRLDLLDEQLEDAWDWERWADENGTQLDLSEYRDNTDTDELPELLTAPYGGCYNGLQTDYDGCKVRDISTFIHPNLTTILITAENTGACGTDLNAKAWEIDVDSLPEIDDENNN